MIKLKNPLKVLKPGIIPKSARSLSFAERIGPVNARKISLHYVGVILIVFIILLIREFCVDYTETKCELWSSRYDDAMKNPESGVTSIPERDSEYHPYWANVICSISTSTNIFAIYLRIYLAFSTYYMSISVVIVDTLMMAAIAKHLWRAMNLARIHKKIDAPRKGVKETTHYNNGSVHNNNKSQENTSGGGGDWTCSIEMFDHDESISCVVDDSLVIELILAFFDFLRVSEINPEMIGASSTYEKMPTAFEYSVLNRSNKMPCPNSTAASSSSASAATSANASVISSPVKLKEFKLTPTSLEIASGVEDPLVLEEDIEEINRPGIGGITEQDVNTLPSILNLMQMATNNLIAQAQK